jgi:hypothetical protein
MSATTTATRSIAFGCSLDEIELPTRSMVSRLSGGRQSSAAIRAMNFLFAVRTVLGRVAPRKISIQNWHVMPKTVKPLCQKLHLRRRKEWGMSTFMQRSKHKG